MFEEVWSVAPPLQSYFLAARPAATPGATRLVVGSRAALDSVLLEYATGAAGLDLVGEIPLTHDWLLGGAVFVDVNGDAVHDMVIPAKSAARLLVLLGRTDGGYDVLPEVELDAAVSARAGVATGDVDGDGKADLVLSPGGIPAVFFGDGTGGFGEAVEVPVSGGSPMYVTDLDADGRGDLLMPDSEGFTLAYSQPGRTFRLVEQGRGEGVTGFEYLVFVPADLDGDGRPELVGFRDDLLTFDGVSSHFEARLHVFSDVGDEGFASDRSLVFEDTCDRHEEVFAPTPRALELDGDGQPDFLFDWTTYCPEDFTFTPLALLYRPQ